MWGFRRSKPKPAKQPYGPNTLEGVSALILDWLERMKALVEARRTARTMELATIDEKMDALCREATEDVERSAGSELSERMKRMKRLGLEEITKMRDNARQERRAYG